ncbi:MAG: type IV pilus modification protein PilV [Gammaproteobacteria bacterium]|jgi:type IV pilus assembly protein PilV
MIPKAKPVPFSAGFTLIEVMVALAVVSIGMLGIASLYTQALGAARTTQYRSQAINLLSDMADRIRGNRLGDLSYAGAAADNNCDLSGGATCTPAQMAAHDLFTWGAQVQALLPAGAWNLARNAADTPPSYTITVTWDEVGQGQVTAQTVVQVPAF